METEKILLYGALAFVAYKLLLAPTSSGGGSSSGTAPAPAPPHPSTAEQATDAAISVAQTYGVDQCIAAGYDPGTCRQAGTSLGGLLDGLFNF